MLSQELLRELSARSIEDGLPDAESARSERGQAIIDNASFELRLRSLE